MNISTATKVNPIFVGQLTIPTQKSLGPHHDRDIFWLKSTQTIGTKAGYASYTDAVSATQELTFGRKSAAALVERDGKFFAMSLLGKQRPTGYADPVFKWRPLALEKVSDAKLYFPKSVQKANIGLRAIVDGANVISDRAFIKV